MMERNDYDWRSDHAALDPRAREVLDFWFGAPHEAAFGAARKIWFDGGPALDATLRERFGALLDAAREGACDAWSDTPLGALALIVLLDQFSRNIHRGTPRAFAADAAALARARALVERGHDRLLPNPHQRAFAYLPFEHDETAASQREAVRLCEQIRHEAGCAGYHDFALKHADVIARFGRFPHRNAILGRPSSDAEQAFLREPGSSF
ncbi:DUF924 domain-containing protein [Burkholderia sp. FERM BP-3421]|jgi:uncharacterized protein (DUF924 family)|uniref:DUF924 family protein n=1 Tax=Burkholderia sp. FERM BP-3421 TaxID=1494466 RepID=UPI002360007C|nr:DUF924 family protein [Burkholderia sp. FERM BP-3421]WDD94755.1 DUF924 domain-containing protein [Burkholderia sp. FERM BP-3421]